MTGSTGDAGTDRPADAAAVAVAMTGIRETPITVAEVADAVAGDDRGAVVTFAGVVRDQDGGRAVVALDYEAHPDASAVLAEVCAEVAASHPGTTIAAVHRVGALVVGDLALAAAVSSGHRAEAFAACVALIDAIKARTPIWKHQRFADGTTEWVGSL